MATTKLLSKQESILWRIPNIAELCKSAKLINKQHFKFDMKVGTAMESDIPPLKWECRLQMMNSSNKEGALNEKHFVLKFSIENVTQQLSECHAKVQVQIGEPGHYSLDIVFTIQMGSSVNPQPGKTPISRFGLPEPSPNLASYLNADGALELKITVTVFLHPREQSALTAFQSHYESLFFHNLGVQLASLGKNPLNISSLATKILSKDGMEFSVDRVILALRSPVFRAMFQSGMSEDQNGLLEVKDMNGMSLKVLLHFIQTGKLLSKWKCEGVIEDLVYGAHKYMITDLLQFLDIVLGLVCTKDNCAKLMVLANMFDMARAQKHLLEYFRKNLSNSVDDLVKFGKNIAAAGSIMLAPESEDERQLQQKKQKTN